MPPKLTDTEAYDRLFNARRALGDEKAETVRGNAVLVAAREMLAALQWGLVESAERGTDRVSSIIYDEPPQKPSLRRRSR